MNIKLPKQFRNDDGTSIVYGLVSRIPSECDHEIGTIYYGDDSEGNSLCIYDFGRANDNLELEIEKDLAEMVNDTDLKRYIQLNQFCPFCGYKFNWKENKS